MSKGQWLDLSRLLENQYQDRGTMRASYRQVTSSKKRWGNCGSWLSQTFVRDGQSPLVDAFGRVF